MTVIYAALDQIDRVILETLREDGRISFRDLAERVQLSPNAAAERVRRLRRTGVITGFTAHIDAEAVGRPLVAMIDIRLRPTVTMAEAEVALRRLPQLVIAAHVTGRSDYLLHVACRDRADMDDLITTLNEQVGAVETETRLMLRDIRPDRPAL
jgi:Lrp/AsnC family transcriptional regulator, leucine-responsive regulatory protein